MENIPGCPHSASTSCNHASVSSRWTLSCLQNTTIRQPNATRDLANRLTSFVTPRHILINPWKNGPPNTRCLLNTTGPLSMSTEGPSHPMIPYNTANSDSSRMTSSSIPGGHVPTTRRPHVLHHTSRPRGPARLVQPLTPRTAENLPQRDGFPDSRNKNRLRWRSDTYLTYLRNTLRTAKARATTLGLDPLAPEYRGPREQHEPNPAPA